MKKIISILLSFSIVFLSVSTCISISVCADTDKTVLSKSSDSPFAYSSSEAQKYVSAHLDIYDSDNTLLFSYTPTSTYNWTYSAKGKDNLHLSDNQLKAFLMSKKTLSAYVQLMFSGFSNNNVTRGFLSALGIATTGNSNALTDVSDKLLGNYNYIDSINYDEDTQTITMDNTSVDNLREEIKQYYYDLIGLCQWKPSGTVKSFVDSSEYRKNFEFEEDYQNAYYSKSKYCIASSYANYALFFDDKFDYMYLSNSEKKNLYYDGWHIDFYKLLYRDGSDFSSKLVGEDKKGLITRYDANPLTNVTVAALYYHASYPQKMALSPSFILGSDGSTYDDMYVKYYSADGSPLLFFKSYSAYYDFINGDQNAYLSSTIEKTGEDITFSIKDMNENLGNKMDTLIDSINSNKSNMSADELQNAIDKGLEDLNKNTEDIKDNTSDILDTLKEQNNILLQILGVTEYIAYQNDKYNNTYTKADMSNLFKKSFNRVSDAVLYGEKVDDDNENTVDRSKFSYHNGIFGHFPFSVPYQLYEWLKILQSEPICPEFTYHYGFLIGISKDSDEYDKYKITFNLSAYDSWREVAASFLKLAFTLTMAIGTYKKFKGEL